MCGIVFSINSDDSCLNLDDWFKDAMIASQVRGLDGAGIYQINDKGECSWVKDAESASEFVQLQSAKDLIRNSGYSPITVGHVRAATVGGVSVGNAHPFTIERDDGTFVSVVHNGTLYNWKGHKDAHKFSVDSEWLAHMLATEGHDAFEYFNGAFAIVWYDSAVPDHVFMARNKERPLHYIVTNDNKTILGCSEVGMLGWLAQKHKFEEKNTPYYLEEGKIYKFSTKNVGKFTVVDYPAYVPRYSTAPAANNNNGVPWYYGQYSQYGVEEDWGDWGYNRPAYNSTFIDKYDLEEQESVIEGVKKALQKARKGETAPIGVVNDAEYRSQVTSDIDLHADADSMPDHIDCGTVTLATVASSTASGIERENAKKLQIFGMVVRFSPVIHDPSTSEVLGTFDSYENGKWREHDAVMRFIPSAKAKEINKEDGQPTLAAVCGISIGAGNDMVILVPLDQAQLDFIKDYQEAMKNPLKARAL